MGTTPVVPIGTSGRGVSVCPVSDYSAPLDDMRFVLEHVTDLAGLAELAGYEHADAETVGGNPRGGGAVLRGAVRPAQPRRRHPAQPAQRRRLGDDAGGIRQGLPPLRRGGLAGGAVPAGVRRRRLPVARRHRHAGDDDGGEHGVLAVPAAHPGRHRHARALRRRAAARDVPAEDGDRGVDRHDEPHRAAGRVRRRRPHHAGRAGGRRHVADHRAEDLHHLRRARPRRQHRPPRPRPRARCAAGDEGDLLLHRPQVPRRRRRRASASATPSSACRSRTRWASTPARRA